MSAYFYTGIGYFAKYTYDDKAEYVDFKSRDQKDTIIAKLKAVNMKLRRTLKDLNGKLEVAIEKTAMDVK